MIDNFTNLSATTNTMVGSARRLFQIMGLILRVLEPSFCHL